MSSVTHVHHHEKRRFIRHPGGVPIRCHRTGHVAPNGDETRNIGCGGLAFASEEPYVPGDIVEIDYPSLRDTQRVQGEIVWSIPTEAPDGPHLNGLKFLDESDHFHARVVEQICHIERYRQAQLRDHGRKLSPQEAAAEWIERTADHFPE